MDDNAYRNVPLDEALKPDPNSPLQPPQYVANAGLDPQTYVSDAQTPRVELGAFANKSGSGYGLKVSKAGFNVQSATSDQLIFNSDQNTFKIVNSGTATIAASSLNTGGALYSWGTSATVTVPHGLSYIPAFIAFENSGGVSYSLVGRPKIESAGGIAGFLQTWVNVATDITNIYFFITSFGFNVNSAVLGATVKYYLLQETAN